MATFKDQQVYDDGVRVEVTKIKHATLTKLNTEVYDSKAMAGAPYVDFNVRVSNGTKARLSLSTSETVTYGSNGDSGRESMSAIFQSIARRPCSRAKRVRCTSRHHPEEVPRRRGHEFSFDEEYDATIFSGSVK